MSAGNPSPILPSGDFASGLSFSPSSSSHQLHNSHSHPASASSTVAATATAGAGAAAHHRDPAHSRSTDHYRLSDPHNNHHNNNLNYGPGTLSATPRHLNHKASEELIGAPFDGSAILNRIEATKSPTSPHRPSIPHPAYTTPDTRLAGLSLHQSASVSAANDNMAAEKARASRASDNQLSQSKRFSDETKEPKMASVLRKKSGFSGFMTSLVGSPKKPTISAPENPVHVTHVGYDSATGQFTVRVAFSKQLPPSLSLSLSPLSLSLSSVPIQVGSKTIQKAHLFGIVPDDSCLLMHLRLLIGTAQGMATLD